LSSVVIAQSFAQPLRYQLKFLIFIANRLIQPRIAQPLEYHAEARSWLQSHAQKRIPA
jgi:hypothetical protein